MNRKIIAAVAAVFVLGLIAGPAAFAKEYKIVYVDLPKIFEQYKKTKASEKALEDKAKAKTEEEKKMVDELKKLQDEQALLSEKGKAGKQTLIDSKMKVLQDFRRNTQEDLMKEKNTALESILKDIEGVIGGYAKEGGYDMVLNSRMLLYGAEQYDVTNEILSRLNK
jgi:outer membrane protein